MAILNPSFEDAGAHPGEAEHWMLRTASSLERIAGFGPDPYRAWEDFERWTDLLDDLDGVTVAVAFFDPMAEGYEDFEDGWDNDFYMTELPAGRIIAAPFGGGAAEDMEAGWSNDAYLGDWSEVPAVTGTFGGNPHEDFERLWRGNEGYARAWADVTSLAALFDGDTRPVENFESDWSVATTT